MSASLIENINYLQPNASLLKGSLRGIERECLRVTADASLSSKPHPSNLGSALTHPLITTDFSESLLEFITAPQLSIEAMLQQLEQIHCFTAQYLDDEFFWSSSMPCKLQQDSQIPIAKYGQSNVGIMKHIYRQGLSNRYGSSMQTVAGIHYNFSIPSGIWCELRWKEQSFLSLQDYTTQGYFRMIRNFKRWYWLLIYLFGSAPVVDKSFIRDKQHRLQPLPNSADTYYAAEATSLRLGELGYQSSIQDRLKVSYNSLNQYISQLLEALSEPHKAYQSIGVKNQQGAWQQLSTGLLQIENEFYSVIRPKQTARSGETQLKALSNRGVEYIEVRCLDINPYEPLGINAKQAALVETFLLTCMLQDSPEMSNEEAELTLNNQRKVVDYGRNSMLKLQQLEASSIVDISLQDWATTIFQAMQPVAKLLDEGHQTNDYQQSIDYYQPLIADSSKTLSSQIIKLLQDNQCSYSDWTMQQSVQFTEQFKGCQLTPTMQQHFQSLAAKSIAKQQMIEQGDTIPFAEFLELYFQQYQHCNFQ